MDNSSGHIRRKRYKGTHPKAFADKYKEQQPDRYSDDVAKVISQGKTPAGMHRSICVNEILNILNVKPGEKGLDATLGYGGHSVEILKRLFPSPDNKFHKTSDGGHLYAIDVDPLELQKTSERLHSLGYGPEMLTIKKMNFSEIDQIVYESGPLDFLVADLGVSSMQIDNPDRGFSFKVDGPLDLRLNSTTGISAVQYLKNVTQEELENVLLQNSDEPFHDVVSIAITDSIKKGVLIKTTTDLKDIISKSLDFISASDKKDQIKKCCQRCFQALRIEINNEFDSLDKFLDKLPDVLAPGGRAAILSFHSGEDRRVKKTFQYFHREGIYCDIAPQPIRPSAEELNSNPRSRPAKLRWAIRA
jgi:16S rRNA (cytosine1402-N4)-methyltransferase